jgi:Ca2+-binding RTX toxin-like protein
VNGNGGANGGNMEKHFIHEGDLPDFATLQDVDYVDPQNYVPAGYSAQGGITINDDDENASDVSAQISGSSNGDLIAAGLNDDSVRAGSGDDRIGGGSGNDTIKGEDGNDTVHGGTGDDKIIGGRGNDELYGGRDDDILSGWGGHDLQYGGLGNDSLYGNQGNDTLDGGEGSDKLSGGSGNDILAGGAGADILIGGSGADVFEFTSGDLMDWDNLSGSSAAKNAQLDLITDFAVGADEIEFENYSNVVSMSDLRAWKTTIDGDVHFTVQVRATNERILVDVADSTSWSQFFDADNFSFV